MVVAEVDFAVDYLGLPVSTRGKPCARCGQRPRFPRNRNQTWCRPCINANQRRRRHEGPIARQPLLPPLRLPGGCLLWRGAVDRKGYGRIKLGRSSVAVHRWAFEQAKGPIMVGLTVDHLCERKLCIELAHLEQCTQAENNKRYWRRRRGTLAVLGKVNS